MKRPTDDKPKTAALKPNVPVVKSAKLPAVPKREYRDFDDFAQRGEFLMRTFKRWGDNLDLGSDEDVSIKGALEMAERMAGEIASQRSHLEAEIKEFDESWFFFERDELYEEARSATNLLGCYTTHVVTHRVVSEQLGFAVALINNAAQNPKLYSRMLVEEIVAARPSACALEATCREIRRTQKFLPSGPELLAILRRQMEHWAELSEIGQDTIPYYEERAPDLIATLKAKLAEQEQQERERKARLEKQEQKRQARIAKEKQEREERMAKEREAREEATREYFGLASQVIALADDPIGARTWFNSELERRKRKEIGIPVDDVIAFIKTTFPNPS